MTAAAEQQMKRLQHTTNIYVYPPLHEYSEKLASHLPDPLKVSWMLIWTDMEAIIRMYNNQLFPLQVIYLTNSGSEANDLAMLMARVHTGNYDIITFR